MLARFFVASHAYQYYEPSVLGHPEQRFGKGAEITEILLRQTSDLKWLPPNDKPIQSSFPGSQTTLI
jgi:hypothetical protein